MTAKTPVCQRCRHPMPATTWRPRLCARCEHGELSVVKDVVGQQENSVAAGRMGCGRDAAYTPATDRNPTEIAEGKGHD